MSKKFGSSISASNTVTIIGAAGADIDGTTDAGTIYNTKDEAAIATVSPAEFTLTIDSGPVSVLQAAGEVIVDVVVGNLPYADVSNLSFDWTVSGYVDVVNQVATPISGTGVTNAGGIFTISLTLKTLDVDGLDFYKSGPQTLTINFNKGIPVDNVITVVPTKPTLYEFTSMRIAPQLTQPGGVPISGVRGAMTGVPNPTATGGWALQSTYLNQVVTGFTEWTVPMDGLYRLTVAGGAGGRSNGWGRNGGLGSVVAASVLLTKGQKVLIATGCRGANNYYDAGGGGATWVALGAKTTATAQTLVMVAAGGGGASASGYAGTGGINGAARGGSSTQGSSTNWATGGSNGQGGGGYSNAGGGGGFFSDGTGNWSGRGWDQNLTNTSYQSFGGFGGGGGGGGTNGSGGGGGYSGGAAAPWSYDAGGGANYTNDSLCSDIIYTATNSTEYGYFEAELLE